MQNASHIVFQAYGNEAILQECLFALLSVSRQHSDAALQSLHIHIYTDRPDWFAQFNIPLALHFHEINAELIRQWRGSIDFVHRVKIKVLQDFTTKHSGAILYMDTDVFLLRPLTDVFNSIREGKLLMHVMESVVAQQANPIMSKLNAFLEKNNPLSIGTGKEQVSAQTAMWNAGVLGFHDRYAPLLNRVLEFTDSVHPIFPKHIVEQFAFSYYFQKEAQVHHTGATVLHYWNFKEFRIYLQSFFAHFKDAGWKELVRLSDLLPITVLLQEKLNFYMNRSMGDKISGKHWRPTLPDWEASAKQLF